MRFIQITLIFCFLSINSYSQLEENTLYNNKQKLIEQTQFIMRKLGIKIRDNISKDGLLDIGIIDPYLETSLSSFFRDSGIVIPNYDTSLRYYLHPIIALKEPIFKVFSKQKDTTQFGLIVCLSAAIHEITHYLQLTYTPNQTKDPTTLAEFVSYLNDASEREAHAVQAYYFLFYYDRATLTLILSTETDLKTKLARLIDAFKTYTDANWRPSFPMNKKIAN